MPKKDVTILDVTIRDGSYAINYQYTPEQVKNIAAALDNAGLDYIEVSHGCGLGARDNLKIPSAASDKEYVLAAKNAVRKAKIGVIAGPSPVTQQKDIDSVINEVDFIRFAANCDNPGILEKNISYALKKKPKLTVFMQLMRSTRRPLSVLLKSGKIAEDMGVNVMYLVDTAGHFLPEEVFKIVSALKSKLRIGIGFHGHNNMGLAIANTLAAIRAGAVSVDASLRGMGRAGGNAQLEALASLLKRNGLGKRLTFDLLVAAGEKFIAPIMPDTHGIEPEDLLTADANIDLYPLEVYQQIAKETGVGFIEFIRTLAADRTLVEAGPNEINRALKKLR